MQKPVSASYQQIVVFRLNIVRMILEVASEDKMKAILGRLVQNSDSNKRKRTISNEVTTALDSNVFVASQLIVV